MDATAISLCMDNKLPIVVFNLRQPGNLRRVIMGEPVGTKVTTERSSRVARTDPRNSTLWMSTTSKD